jgi:hypothetical protein
MKQNNTVNISASELSSLIIFYNYAYKTEYTLQNNGKI